MIDQSNLNAAETLVIATTTDASTAVNPPADRSDISESTGETEAGAFFVSVGFVGNLKPYVFENGEYTVEAVLKMSGIQSDGHEIRIDGQPGSLDTVLKSKQTVMLLRPIRGNMRPILGNQTERF